MNGGGDEELALATDEERATVVRDIAAGKTRRGDAQQQEAEQQKQREDELHVQQWSSTQCELSLMREKEERERALGRVKRKSVSIYGKRVKRD